MENTDTTKYQVRKKKLPASRLEISAIIPAGDFDALRDKALRRIGEEVELPGFRKGHVPGKLIAQRFGEGVILEEMAEMAISRAYAEIIIGEKIDALGRPEVKITKMAQGNPLEFTLTTAVFPEISLPDYRTIAKKVMKKKEDIVVSDEEVKKATDEIRKMRARKDARGEAPDAGVAEHEELPPLDDEFVKTLGEFTGVEDFTQKLKENMLTEKRREARDKKRVAIIEGIIADTKLELPEIIIEQELHRMEDEFASELSRMGMTMEAYLKAIGKTHEEVEKEWRPDAEKRAKVQLITTRIAEKEGIVPDPEQLKTEVGELLKKYPDASRERAEGYISLLLTNDKVFSFLESTEGT